MKLEFNSIDEIKEFMNQLGNKTKQANTNSDNRISGDCNSDNRISGDCNSGSCNSGSYNSGNWNSGSYNSGSCNSGSYNSGNWNSGSYNSGNYNSGNWNSGSCNSGNYNSGNWNSGICNSGSWNSGNWNSGYRNRGNWNSGNWNSGYFNVDEPKIRIFGKEIDLKRNDIHFPDWLYFGLTEWISHDTATEEEKNEHKKEIETCGGFLRTLKYKEAFKMAYDKTNDEEKKQLFELPNFNIKIFKQISGIDVTKDYKRIMKTC